MRVEESRIVDAQTSRWIPKPLRPWLAKRWVKAILVLVLFAVVGLILGARLGIFFVLEGRLGDALRDTFPRLFRRTQP